jgi:hypothetical protein
LPNPAVDWDLVVIDEAHRLRNVYKTDNKVASAIRAAPEDEPKLLLTRRFAPTTVRRA